MPKEKVLEVVKDLLKDTNIDEGQCVLQGPDVGKTFFIAFKGSDRIAAGLADQFADSLCDRSGERPIWKEVNVLDVKDAPQRVYIRKDVSPRDERKEMLTWKLGKILESQGVTDVFTNKKQGEISCDFQPLAKVDVVSRTEANILWNNEVAARCSALKKKEAIDEFCKTRRGAANVQWSSS